MGLLTLLGLPLLLPLLPHYSTNVNFTLGCSHSDRSHLLLACCRCFRIVLIVRRSTAAY